LSEFAVKLRAAVDVKAVPESRAEVKSNTVAEATAEVQDCV
jgi:hypothetical protein